MPHGIDQIRYFAIGLHFSKLRWRHHCTRQPQRPIINLVAKTQSLSCPGFKCPGILCGLPTCLNEFWGIAKVPSESHLRQPLGSGRIKAAIIYFPHAACTLIYFQDRVARVVPSGTCVGMDGISRFISSDFLDPKHGSGRISLPQILLDAQPLPCRVTNRVDVKCNHHEGFLLFRIRCSRGPCRFWALHLPATLSWVKQVRCLEVRSSELEPCLASKWASDGPGVERPAMQCRWWSQQWD